MTTTVRNRAGLATLAVVVALLFGACSDSSGSAADTPATTAADARGSAEILSLDAPGSVDCAGATKMTVAVTYSTSGAASQRLVVDGLPIDGVTQPSATVDVPVHCDPLPHTVVLIAKDAQGGRTTKQLTVETQHGAGS
ncbi:MAG TPA: hypothetical protein VFZ17_05975 [Acidimicrobiia bacterium]|nr:hypothetical protein [Acidimicrobiia bacterium]